MEKRGKMPRNTDEKRGKMPRNANVVLPVNLYLHNDALSMVWQKEFSNTILIAKIVFPNIKNRESLLFTEDFDVLDHDGLFGFLV